MLHNKLYTSKEGLRFKISVKNLPAEGDIVYFRPDEYDWIVANKLSSQEFRYLHGAKKEDPLYQIVPDQELSPPAKLANTYAPQIISMLRGSKHVAKESIQEVGGSPESEPLWQDVPLEAGGLDFSALGLEAESGRDQGLETSGFDLPD